MAEASDPSLPRKEEQLQPATEASPAPHAPSDVDGSPWLSYTVAKAQELHRSVAESTDTALQSTRSYLTDLQSASLEYSQSLQNIFWTVQSEYGHYENLFFGKVKEGLQISGNHPGITYSVMVGAGLLLMRRPRRLLFRYTIGRFQSEESLLTSSEKRIKELRQSVDLLKNESKKLEERARFAEDELLRGRTKLKQVGTQLQNLVTSIHKTESQAKGLMESLRELPGRDALRFRAEVASMAAEAKQQRNGLTKKVSKIANYGIPV